MRPERIQLFGKVLKADCLKECFILTTFTTIGFSKAENFEPLNPPEFYPPQEGGQALNPKPYTLYPEPLSFCLFNKFNQLNVRNDQNDLNNAWLFIS